MEDGIEKTEFSKGHSRFPKSERLHHRSLIEGLFRNGQSFYEFPFRVSWRCMDTDELSKNFRTVIPDNIGLVQLMVTVPKKKRRKAVDRVCIRRKIREAYRLNKSEFLNIVALNEDIRTLSLALIYIHNENLDFNVMEDKVKKILVRLQTKIGKPCQEY